MNPVQEKMIAEMGIGVIWTLRPNSHEDQILSQVVMPAHLSPASSNLADLSEHIEMKNALGTDSSNSACQLCGWRSIDSKPIATGQSPSATYLFIHEHSCDSVSAAESVLAGAANALLNGILRELHIKRGITAFLASIVKATPIEVARSHSYGQDGEILACVSCVKKEIELISPSVIISLGNIAAISLLGLECSSSINDLRGAWHQYERTPLIVTHELEYLLQHPKEKFSLWSDLCIAVSAIPIH